MSIRDIFGGGASLFIGLGVTLRNLWRKPVTETYPHREPELSPAFRSAIKLLRFDETNTHDCIACMQCVRICPSYCITIDGTRHEGVKGKRAEKFEVDYALCSVCGLCIDVCPTDTLGYSRVYDMVSFERHGFTFDLLDGFREDEMAYIQRMQEKAAEEAEALARTKAEAAAREAAAPPTAPPTDPPTAPPTDPQASPGTSPPASHGAEGEGDGEGGAKG